MHSCLFFVLLLISPFIVVFPQRSHGVAPPNPFLLDSPWPITHHDNYAQQSTLIEGPTSGGRLQAEALFGKQVAGTLTLLYTADRKAMWGSALTTVFKVDRSGPRLRLIDAVAKDPDLKLHDTFRGIYGFISNEGIFYTGGYQMIFGYTDKVAGDSMSHITPVGKFGFELALEGERILAISMTYDGYIAFVTNAARVGIVTRNLTQLVDFAELAHPDEPPLSVTNSLAIDEYGGIYVVSSRYLHRLWWDSNLKRLHSVTSNPSSDEKALRIECLESSDEGDEDGDSGTVSPNDSSCGVWTAPYDIEDYPITSRPTKYGSGTTPSLFRASDGRLYVTIADGSRKQKIAVFDAFNGDEVGSAPVNFEGDGKDTEGLEEDSYTEQSVLVHGDRLVIVQNALTAMGSRLNAFLESVDAERRVAAMGVPEFVAENVFLLPVVLGDSPRGYQQFRFDPTLPPADRLHSVWSKSDSGCPNAIPVMSVPSNLVYCVGKVGSRGQGYPEEGFRGTWAVEAVDWDTGRRVFTVKTGADIRFNALYAATQVGPERELVYGSMGGIVRLRDLDANETPKATEIDVEDMDGDVVMPREKERPRMFHRHHRRDRKTVV